MFRPTNCTTMYFTLNKGRLCLLGHFLRLGEERTQKYLLYGVFVVGKRKRGRPKLRFKEFCKPDLKTVIKELLNGSFLQMTSPNNDQKKTQKTDRNGK